MYTRYVVQMSEVVQMSDLKFVPISFLYIVQYVLQYSSKASFCKLQKGKLIPVSIHWSSTLTRSFKNPQCWWTLMSGSLWHCCCFESVCFSGIQTVLCRHFVLPSYQQKKEKENASGNRFQQTWDRDEKGRCRRRSTCGALLCLLIVLVIHHMIGSSCAFSHVLWCYNMAQNAGIWSLLSKLNFYHPFEVALVGLWVTHCSEVYTEHSFIMLLLTLLWK